MEKVGGRTKVFGRDNVVSTEFHNLSNYRPPHLLLCNVEHRCCLLEHQRRLHPSPILRSSINNAIADSMGYIVEQTRSSSSMDCIHDVIVIALAEIGSLVLLGL